LERGLIVLDKGRMCADSSAVIVHMNNHTLLCQSTILRNLVDFLCTFEFHHFLFLIGRLILTAYIIIWYELSGVL